ncbi:hypothetical protein P4829_16560 [Bacillus atrophaeus]|uniref:hypothetical protein n=1 Tax=Bacillus atrophaeus TaxID=1452 RepID=UPI0007C5733A|nr:hypothetical protein [Bacillus atrophaeus]MDS9996252.1 hypothetical protein [Bacillus atrophaeus]WFE13470.1 hypothetical protein P4829_16560 [Bacillus atrophaeus]
MKEHDEVKHMIEGLHEQMPELNNLLRLNSVPLPEDAAQSPLPPKTWFDRLSHWLTYPSWQLPDLLSLRSFSHTFAIFPILSGSFAAQILFFLFLGR